MAGQKQFQCLRCDNRFMGPYDPKEVVERTCQKCGSNSVWLEPAGGAPPASKPTVKAGEVKRG